MNAPDDELPPLTTPPAWAIAFAFAIIYLSWGTTYRATGIAMKEEHMPPALFGGVRLIIAGIVLLAYQYFRGQSLRLTGQTYFGLFIVSLFFFLGASYLVNIGQKEVESGVAAILIATTPLWIGLFGMLWPGGERLSGLGWLGLLIGFAGISLTKFGDGDKTLNILHSCFILGSAASWALGSLLSRHLAMKIPHLTSAGFQMLFGGLSQVTLGTLTGEWQQFPEEFSLRALGAFLHLLFVGSLIGFVAFNWLLAHIPAAKVGTYAYVNPIIAVFIGWCAGEAINHWLFAGIAVILVGVYLVRHDHLPVKEIELEPD